MEMQKASRCRLSRAFLAAVEVLSALSYCGSATVHLCQAWWTALGLAAMRLFPSGHFHDFLDRRDEKFIHLPAYLVVRYIDSGAIEIGAFGFENLADAVFLDFGSDEAACEIFRIRAGHTELFCGPKSKHFVAPRPRLEFQFFVMGEFRFESMLTLVDSRHDPPHGTVASPHLGGDFDYSNILQEHSCLTQRRCSSISSYIPLRISAKDQTSVATGRDRFFVNLELPAWRSVSLALPGNSLSDRLGLVSLLLDRNKLCPLDPRRQISASPTAPARR